MKKILTIIVLMMILAGSFSFASAGTVIEGEYKGEYETVKVREDVNLVKDDTMTVTAEDYFKYLKYVYIGNGLKIKVTSKLDCEKAQSMQTNEAKLKNEEYIRIAKASKENRRILRAARRKAEIKAKQEYYKVWNLESVEMKMPSGSAGETKTYMDYKSVTSKGSSQYALLHDKKAESKDGFRMVDGYYCVAMGSFYGKQIGTKYYIDLANGKRIRCILGDQKSNKHTDSNHQYAVKNKDIIEFIVDNIKLSGGDISSVPGFEGKIVRIRKITDKRAYEDEIFTNRLMKTKKPI